MAGKSGISTVLLLVITAFAVAGCFSPVGGIGQGAGTPPKASVLEGLEVEYKLAYVQDDYFKRKDLTLYTITYGSNRREEVTPDNVTIEDSPGSNDFKIVPLPNANPDGHKLTRTGDYGVRVEHKTEGRTLSIGYTISVSASGPGFIPTSGIKIRWEGDPE